MTRRSTPTLLPSTGKSTFTENKAPTTVTYTGSTSITSGNSPVLSATLTSNGAPLAGQTVTFTVGSGSSAQNCSGTTNSAGKVSCSICSFNQSASPLPVTVTYGGNSYYVGLDHVAVGHRDHADVAVRERRHRGHGVTHHGHRHADQPGHGSGDQRADRHA